MPILRQTSDGYGLLDESHHGIAAEIKATIPHLRLTAISRYLLEIKH